MNDEPTERDMEALAREYAEGQTCYRVTNPAAFRNDLTEAFMAGVSAATDWPLPLADVQEIVGHLIHNGTRDGLVFGDRLNAAMGASARRRAALRATP